MRLGVFSARKRIERPPEDFRVRIDKGKLVFEHPDFTSGMMRVQDIDWELRGIRHFIGKQVERYWRRNRSMVFVPIHHQAEKGGLAAAVSSDEAAFPARVDLGACVFVDVVVTAVIGKGEICDFYG